MHLALVIVAGVAVVVAMLFLGGRSAAQAGGLFLLLAAAGFVQLYAAYRSSKRTRARPRKEYLLWSLCWGALTLVGLGAVGYASQDHLHLLPMGLLGATVWCFVYALALFARGVFRGSLRRAFWAYPPWWALDGAPSVLDAPQAARARCEQSPLRPSGSSALIDHSLGAAFIRKQSVHEVPAGGYQHHKAAGTGRYEVICVACGDNSDLDYSDAAPEVKHVRGPYRTADAAREALREHLKLLSGH